MAPLINASASPEPSTNLALLMIFFVILVMAAFASWLYYGARSMRSQAKPLGTSKYEVVYMRGGCPHCVKFDKTFKDTSEDVDMQQRFYFEETIHVGSDGKNDVFRGISCAAYPCHLVFDESKNLAGMDTGYKNVHAFKTWLNKIASPSPS